MNALKPPNPATLGVTPPPDPDWFAIFTQHFRPDQVAALVDWLDEDEDTRPDGAESSYYQQRKPPYKSRNGPMRTPGELRLVKGFDDPDTLPLLFGKHVEPNADVDLGGSEALLTPYPGSQDVLGRPREPTKVNLNTVDPSAADSNDAVVLTPLIRGLLVGAGGADANRIVEGILAERQRLMQDGKQFHSMSDVQRSINSLNPPPRFMNRLSRVADVKSAYFRVVSEGRVGKSVIIDGREVGDIIKKRIVAVVRRNPSPPLALTLVYFKVE